MRGSATPRTITALAALLLGAAGCTICPDPFDYCGPVPDGSAPQHDFRLRANGIVPLGSHPLPWPPVVQAAPRPDDEPRTAIAAAEPAAEGDRDAGQPDASADMPADDVQPVAAEATEEAADDTDVPSPRPVDEAPDVIAVPEEPVLEAILPPIAPQRPEILPPVRETPGWKPRR